MKLELGSLEGTAFGDILQRAQDMHDDEQYALQVDAGELDGYPDGERYERGQRFLALAQRVGAPPAVHIGDVVPPQSVLGRVLSSF